MSFLNEYEKENWQKKNYFYAGTIFVVILTIISYFFMQEKLSLFIEGKRKIYQMFTAMLCHTTVPHLIVNLVCFSLVGLFTERRLGTIGFLITYFVLSVYATLALYFVLDGGFIGMSHLNYAFYGLIITTCIFEFKRVFKTKWIWLNLPIILSLLFAMFWNGTENNIAFALYPADLLKPVHWPGIMVGFLLGVFYYMNNQILKNNSK